MQPERSNVYDIGVDQKIYAIPGLEMGLDAYYKTATDLLDDGQFGQAYVLSAFNYARGQNAGVELKANYTNGNLRLYGNIAWARQRATQIVSNQYLFAPDELAYIANAYVYTDHAQLLTASAGASYLWNGTQVLGRHDLRQRPAQRLCQHHDAAVLHPGQCRGLARFQLGVGDQADHAALRCRQPVRLRSIKIRDGSGIGVFAPQFGPRRGFYFGISQKL